MTFIACYGNSLMNPCLNNLVIYEKSVVSNVENHSTIGCKFFCLIYILGFCILQTRKNMMEKAWILFGVHGDSLLDF